MKTVIIGGGKGCQAILDLARGAFLKEMILDVICVMDLDHDAPGLAYAKSHGMKTTNDMAAALSIPDIELIIELTGSNAVLDKIIQNLPRGAKLIDHTFAHIFWDLANAQAEQERRLAEKTELKQEVEKEQLYIQSLFDSIPDLVMVLNKERKVIRTNARFTEYTGIPQKDAIGKQCFELFQSTNLAIDCLYAACNLDKVFASGKPLSSVHQSISPAESFWEVTQTPIKNERGDIEAVIETWHRITERVMLRREIERAEERFRRFIDAAMDHICIKDLEGRYLVVNKTIAKAYGLEKKDFFGKKVEEVLPEGVAMIVDRNDREVMKKNVHRTYEETFQINEQNRHFNTVRFPLPDYKGKATGVCTIARDVTVKKQLQDKLVQSTKLAAVGKLAAGVAHEINNPLTGVLAFAESILEEVPEDSDLHNDVKVIIRETLRCRDIVRNLLDFAKQETPRFEKTDANSIVDKTLSLVEKLPRFKNVTLEMKKAEELPLIRADPSQLQQVVLNLMLNALDAMKEKGTITLKTEYDRNQNKCVISVEDTGPGIPENMIDKIFEPFFSSKETSGLGLAVSWGIVERHRGVIEVDTAENEGAIFRIVLPPAR